MRSFVSVSFSLLLLLVMGGETKSASGKQITVAMMPKSKGNAYFISCRKGAEAAAKQLGAKLLWDGPTDPDPARQEGISTALRKAREKGIKVITWDSDAAPDARDFLINQATPEGIGFALMDEGAKALGGKGEFAIITASLTAANMNEWQKYIEQRRAEKYPDIKMVFLRPCDDLKDKAFSEATAILNANPNVKLLMAICSPAVPGASEAVKQSGRKDVKVVGLGLPNDNKRYVRDGITPSVILWNTENLGYLSVLAAVAVAKGELKAGATKFNGGRLGELEVKGDNVLLGKPFVFTKENIEQFDF